MFGQEKVEPERVVIDTNVVVSALLFGGEINKIVSLWQKKKIVLLASKEVMEEYIKVLSYPKFNLAKEEIEYIVKQEILPFIKPINVSTKIKIIKDDPSDNKFISLAVDGHAQYIVSGDKHLLKLKNYQKIKIVTAKQFLEKHK